MDRAEDKSVVTQQFASANTTDDFARCTKKLCDPDSRSQLINAREKWNNLVLFKTILL